MFLSPFRGRGKERGLQAIVRRPLSPPFPLTGERRKKEQG
jgi:hypothetical protein